MPLEKPQCEINTHTGEVIFNGKSTVLRPKTFQLFLLLSSKPETVFSKDEILSSVWQGSIVEEQVIFQSINEIRKELGDPDVIKTYPRRGYSIGIQVIIDMRSAENPPNKVGAVKTALNKNYLLAAAVSLVVLVVATIFYLKPTNSVNQPISEQVASRKNSDVVDSSHKGILILPFNVSSLDTPLQWLRYGAMEGVINNINPDKNITLFHLEDVIEILNRVPVGQRNNIANIFERSGASHILQTSVTGNTGDLTFVYSIYSKTERITETINVTSPDDAYIRMVDSIEKVVDKPLQYNEQFLDGKLQNDLIAKTVQFMEIGDLASASTFIKSAVINEPTNMMALYFLTKISLELGAIDEVLRTTTNALAIISDSESAKYEPRLLYFKGMAHLSKLEFKTAEKDLLAAHNTARDAKDWLYVAYSQSMLGKLHQMQQQYTQAFKMFSSAMEYQELLNCPLGITQAYVDFADLQLQKGEHDSAKQYLDKAKRLVSAKKLSKAQPLIDEIENKFKRATSF